MLIIVSADAYRCMTALKHQAIGIGIGIATPVQAPKLGNIRDRTCGAQGRAQWCVTAHVVVLGYSSTRTSLCVELS